MAYRTFKVFCFILVFFSLRLFSQDFPLADKVHYQQFLNTKTFVVEFGDPFSEFNDYIKDAMQKHWKLTSYQFISEKDFETRMADPNASFIFLSEAASSGRFAMHLNLLNVVLGHKSKDLNKMPDLGSVPISYVFEDDEDFDEEESFYLMGVFLKFIQYYIKYNATNTSADVNKIISNNKNELKDLEIWFTKDQLAHDVNTLEKISKVYKHKVRIVTIDEIEKAINQNKKGVAVLHKVGPGNNKGRTLKFILGAEDGKPYYFNHTVVSPNKPDAFLIEDFKNLVQ